MSCEVRRVKSELVKSPLRNVPLVSDYYVQYALLSSQPPPLWGSWVSMCVWKTILMYDTVLIGWKKEWLSEKTEEEKKETQGVGWRLKRR